MSSQPLRKKALDAIKKRHVAQYLGIEVQEDAIEGSELEEEEDNNSTIQEHEEEEDNETISTENNTNDATEEEDLEDHIEVNQQHFGRYSHLLEIDDGYGDDIYGGDSAPELPTIDEIVEYVRNTPPPTQAKKRSHDEFDNDSDSLDGHLREFELEALTKQYNNTRKSGSSTPSFKKHRVDQVCNFDGGDLDVDETRELDDYYV